jgi:hypothetical protein
MFFTDMDDTLKPVIRMSFGGLMEKILLHIQNQGNTPSGASPSPGISKGHKGRPFNLVNPGHVELTSPQPLFRKEKG